MGESVNILFWKEKLVVPIPQFFCSTPRGSTVSDLVVAAAISDETGTESMYVTPNVSVVIPTLGRDSLMAAVQSALSQSTPPLEVIVGADTTEHLTLPEDDRVVVVRCGPLAGGNTARSAAIRKVRGDLVALLDDDDLWETNKLEVQLARLRESSSVDPDEPWVLSSRFTDADGVVRPASLITLHEDLLAYLFEKRSVRGGIGRIHTSTVIAPRWVFDEVPFDPAIKFNQDTTWYIQLMKKYPNAVVVQCPEALVKVDRPSATLTARGVQGSVSAAIKWRESADWVSCHMVGLKPRWRGDYALTDQLYRAMATPDRAEHMRAFLSAFRLGRPGLPAIAYALLKLAFNEICSVRASLPR